MAVYTKQVKIRTTASEKDAWDEKAREMGLEFSEWARAGLNQLAGFDPSREIAALQAAAVREEDELQDVQSEPEPSSKRILCQRCARLERCWGKPPVEGCPDCKYVEVIE